jgi:hypothetical protein
MVGLMGERTRWTQHCCSGAGAHSGGGLSRPTHLYARVDRRCDRFYVHTIVSRIETGLWERSMGHFCAAAVMWRAAVYVAIDQQNVILYTLNQCFSLHERTKEFIYGEASHPAGPQSPPEHALHESQRSVAPR